MPADEKLLADFDAHLKGLEKLKSWIDRLYYDPEFSTFFNRPVLSMLSTGCDYLSENLKGLRSKYILKYET